MADEEYGVTRDEAIKKAEALMEQGWIIYFKAKCPYCNTLLMFQEANTMHETMQCCACNKEFQPTRFGIMAMKPILAANAGPTWEPGKSFSKN